MRISFRAVAFAVFFWLAGPLPGPFQVSRPAQAQTPVDLELVLAIDVSGSVDPEEAKLQRDGYIAAFLNPRIQKAITGGPYGRIVVTYVEWAGDAMQRTVVGWTVLQDRRSLENFVSAIGEAPMTSAHWTSISGAIDYSVKLFGQGYEGTRRVIDISGDGENNRGRPAEWARDEAVARGITINGLPILNDRPNPWGGAPTANLEEYYRNSVIGGPGAFLVPAKDFEAFGEAVLKKLLLEISGATPGVDFAAR